MDRQDDPTLGGDLLLLRRIPPWADQVTWGEDGTPTPSSMNFKDKADELSVNIAQETTVEAVLSGHDGFGLSQFTARHVREACGSKVILCRCTEEPEEGHVLICGKVSGGAAKRLQKCAKWVAGRWPARLAPGM